MKRIAVIGGTGDLGFGLAVRLARGHHSVVVGSRDLAKAKDAAARVSSLSGARVEGRANGDAVEGCDVVILAIPDLSSGALLDPLRRGLEGKLVVSPIVPMVLEGGLFSPSWDGGPSAAERVAALLKGSRVAGAFHNVPAEELAKPEKELEYDVLVTADSKEVFAEAAQVVSSIRRLRPLYAGPLKVSRTVEAMTPVLLNVSKLNRIKNPSIKVV